MGEVMSVPSVEDKILYIAEMLRELHRMAAGEKLEMLCYFIGMVIIEAEETYYKGRIHQG